MNPAKLLIITRFIFYSFLIFAALAEICLADICPDGHRYWKVFTSPTGYWLTAVWGSSVSDVYAVDLPGTILHYDGTSWKSVPSPTGKALYAVWGSSTNDVFAVGIDGTILHYDGTSWAAMTSGTSKSLWGVWGSSASDVFAVGDDGTILQYDGSHWSKMTSPTGKILRAVWGSSTNNVVAVGSPGTIIHYDGTSWKAVSSPTSGDLDGVWMSSAGDVFAVGGPGTILHLDCSSNRQFPWHSIIGAINAPRCSSNHLDLCDNLKDCYYQGGYWYNDTCNTEAYTGDDKTILLVDGNFMKLGVRLGIDYPNIRITKIEKKKSSGEIYQDEGYKTIFVEEGRYYDENLPDLLSVTTITQWQKAGKKISSYHFAQEPTGGIVAYFDHYGNPYNYPYGIKYMESPLSVGKAWGYDISHDYGIVGCYYKIKENNLVTSVETIKLQKFGNIQAFKVVFNYFWRRYSEGSCIYSPRTVTTNGYYYIHPKIGLLTIYKDTYRSGGAPTYVSEIQNDELIETDVDTSQLPRN